MVSDMPGTLGRLIDRCQALAAGMLGVDELPADTARQIDELAEAVATAAEPDWAVYFARQLATLCAGAVGHLALDAPAGYEDLLAGIREDRLALKPLVVATPPDPGLLQELRAWQREHGVTPAPSGEPSPLR